MEKMALQTELQRTRPDYVVYIPKSVDGSTFDSGNEHFLVFDGPDGSLMVVWTQSTGEAEPDQRLVFSRSEDEGKSWLPPKLIAGPIPPAKGGMASWGFPLVSRSGRIYALYNKYVGKHDFGFGITGLMEGIYSDDCGKTWSGPQNIPMPRSIYDNPDPSMPADWIVWQKPERLSKGKYLAGFTRWVSTTKRRKPPVDCWTFLEAVVEFMRFENLDEDPAPGDLQINYLTPNEKALRGTSPEYPELTAIQEPSTVALPDGRLFVIMRTPFGSSYYSVSDDQGETWRTPEPIRYTDEGPALLHPCSPCPIYSLRDGRYVFFYHNHDGHFQQWGPFDTVSHRRPIYVSLGEYRPGARQPLWFSQPKFMMDDDGVRVGLYAGVGREDMAMYASLTVRKNRPVLWYPDRKYFLLGRNIDQELLSGLTVPEFRKK